MKSVLLKAPQKETAANNHKEVLFTCMLQQVNVKPIFNYIKINLILYNFWNNESASFAPTHQIKILFLFYSQGSTGCVNSMT